MTHDELLTKIDTIEARYTDYSSYLALSAVVELHKPVYHEYPNGNTKTECSHCNDGCWGCEEWQNCGDDCGCKCHQAGDEYPCPTIQIIEEQLHANI